MILIPLVPTLSVFVFVLLIGSHAFVAQTLKWKYATGGQVLSSPVPSLNGSGTVYVGSSDHNLYAITSKGVLKWKFATDGQVWSSPALGPDGTVYVGSRDNNIYAITAAGRLKWKYATSGQVWSSPALGPDGTVTTTTFMLSPRRAV